MGVVCLLRATHVLNNNERRRARMGAICCGSFLLVQLLFMLLVHHAYPIVKQPVIIDTDIGSFIDDTFAIVYAAQSEELDVKLVITCSDDTTARAKVAAKLLRLIGRDDIPIGIGVKNDNDTVHYLFDWAKNEDLSGYKGSVYEDGVGKMNEIISNSEVPVDIIAIGPMTNFPMLTKQFTGNVANVRIRAMAGSIFRGYNNSAMTVPEYNVAMCPWCMNTLLNFGWNITITPLDTCGTMTLNAGEVKYILEGDDTTSLALASSLMYFCINAREVCDLKVETPVLYDAVATLLAMPKVSAEFVVFKNMMLCVNETGYTVVDEQGGVPISVALSWKDQGQLYFADLLAKNYVTTIN